MPRPRSISDHQILAKARSYFIQHGHTASVKGLAKLLGVSHAALFQRFGSKKRLMICALAPPSNLDWPEHIKEGPCHGFEKRDLLILCKTMSAFFQQHIPSTRVIQSAGILPEEIFTQGRPFPLVAINQIKEWVDLGVQKGIFLTCDSHSVAMAIVGSLFAQVQISRLTKVHQDIYTSLWYDSTPDSLEGLVDFLIRGLCSSTSFKTEDHPSS